MNKQFSLRILGIVKRLRQEYESAHPYSTWNYNRHFNTKWMGIDKPVVTELAPGDPQKARLRARRRFV